MCVNFIHKWRNLQFKVDFERQIFWETYLRVFDRNPLRGNTFVVMSGLGVEAWLFVSFSFLLGHWKPWQFAHYTVDQTRCVDHTTVENDISLLSLNKMQDVECPYRRITTIAYREDINMLLFRCCILQIPLFFTGYWRFTGYCSAYYASQYRLTTNLHYRCYSFKKRTKSECDY